MKKIVSFYIDEEILQLFDELGIKNYSQFVNDLLLYVLRKMKKQRKIKKFAKNPYSLVFSSLL